jgi:hypothetical protein
MCTMLVAPQMRTKRSADAVCYQDIKFKRAEQTEERKRQLSMKWVVVADEHGNRRFQMRWTVAVLHSSHVSFSDTTMCSTCDGPGGDPTPGPEARVAIS